MPLYTVIIYHHNSWAIAPFVECGLFSQDIAGITSFETSNMSRAARAISVHTDRVPYARGSEFHFEDSATPKYVVFRFRKDYQW